MKLDDAYNNADHIPGAERFLERWQTKAMAFRGAMGARARLGLTYGSSPRQKLDLFLPEGPERGLVVFVHGGYWLRFDRSWWSHLARGPLERGWAVAMPSYDLCPDVRIADITRQVARAIGEAAGMVAGPIALAGHSAGGHLVARMCVAGVLAADVAARLRHVLSISPVSDLRPLLETSMNAQFRMDEAAATAESPALMRPIDVPVTVWVGAEERPVFLDQARWLAKAWSCDCVVAEGRHHFDVIDSLEEADSKMVARLLG